MRREQHTQHASLWRNKDYLTLWAGQMVSVTGTQITDITLPLLVLALTHSPASAGLIAAAGGLPFPIFGLLAGALVDRWDRRHVMIVCEGVSCLAMVSIPITLWLGHLSILQLGAVAMVTGTAFVFFNVAEIAALPSVVGPEQITSATAQNQAAFSAGGVIGPPLGGVLFGISHALPFLFDALSYGASFLSLLSVRRSFGGGHQQERHMMVEIGEGLAWLWKHSAIRTLTLITAGGNFLTGGFTLLIIVLARQQHAQPALIGLMFAIASAGAVAGAIMAPALSRQFSMRQIVAGLYWLSALLYPLYLAAPNPIVIGAITGIIFLIGPAYNVTVISYRLACVPDQLSGRVNGTARMIIFSVSPLGAGLMGIVLQTAGPRLAIIGIAGCMGILAAISTGSRAIGDASLAARVQTA